MLENIKSPGEIKNLSNEQLEVLASEIRDKIIETVSANGGHLGSNLGLVEATLIIHKMFDIPHDKLLFDVGHQCYAHKLITGRYDRFDTLRKEEGISGFCNRFESEYDTLTAGHSGSSVSAALGVATAAKLSGSDAYTVCVVGDGSFTNGMIYEALNNCNNKNIRLIIILNDNEMSISQNVGSLAAYLSKIRTSGFYYKFKRNLQRVLRKLPFVGEKIIVFARHIKNAVKRVFYKQPFFEALGVKYLGPVDGNDLERLQVVLDEAKKDGTCTLVHIKTKKGYGYKYAEESPESYHSVSAFDPDSGVNHTGGNDFSSQFGKILCDAAEKNDKICAITSAMRDGTGLAGFAERFPKRFFDVGIAEEHEIAFAGGLALSGYLPVCAVYSTFAQRTYDQIIHDVSIQKLHIVLALDRAGIVPGDGETHQGIFDCAFLSSIPSALIYSPDSFDELASTLHKAINAQGVAVVRYPKGGMCEYDRQSFENFGDYAVCNTFCAQKTDIVLITYGRITCDVYFAAKRLAGRGVKTKIIKLIKVFPLDMALEAIENLSAGAGGIYIAEEGVESGGIAGKIVSELTCRGKTGAKFRIKAMPEGVYPPHGSLEYVKAWAGLDEKSLEKDIFDFYQQIIV